MKISNHILVGESGENIPFIKSPNHSSGISPVYLIMHYTAGTTLSGTVSWFQNSQAQASAHLVIDRDGSIVQMVAFNRRAWHAGKSKWGNLEGINNYSIGIELVNAGKLKKDASGRWVNWSGKTVPDTEVTIAKHKDEDLETGWQEYPEVQIEAAVAVGALLHEFYNFTDVLGHDDISPGRKVDPGPLFPLNSFRSIVLGRA
ncbi:N-acetylmuramoyl-L-alanine amidase [Pseudomonas sp. TUM22785]|uniref:N-acetylmuramoyl-L-alanine amidase n=1 Tax=Pseudomonas sp. TUM22785 TaxID=3019098 RepID=UPI002305C7B6|nr:N-acetylmuramoyl-L-alanine amidase [Pseudomonas sp. TUM22785]WCD77875.1 N-acetylmuramoyl-L-alanine amidase [Pseudomonas sp. TUM22785]